MASAELARLWKLHLIDEKIAEIRVRAAKLDVGQTLMAQLKQAEAEDAEKGATYRRLHGELTQLEDENAKIDAKLKKLDQEMYGGGVVSPREVATMNKEIASLKSQRDAHDARILELWEEIPPHQKVAEEIAGTIKQLKHQIVERRKAAIEEKAALEKAFNEMIARRPEAAKGFNPTLMARYDDLLKKAKGIAMARVTKELSCAACGNLVPERALNQLREDKVIYCDSCHRILYFTEGIV